MLAYDELMAHERETLLLSSVAGRLSWDQETVMPRGAAEQRSEELAAMEKVVHARRSASKVGDWLAALEGMALEDAAAANLRHIRRSYDRARKVPAELAAEVARATSAAQGIWAAARRADRFEDFAPTLETVLRLKREEAAAIANGGNLYDALLDDYEPGATGAGLAKMFDAMRPRLVALRERILGSKIRPKAISGEFGESEQLLLSHQLAKAFGYDFGRGRIDQAVHPFSSGSGRDVRITTRTSPEDPFNCIYSTIHEVGHATYEQGIDDAFLLTPLGRGVSMGVHESQSRIYENQLGRSRAFTGYLFKRMREYFADFGIPDADAFYASVNNVAPGYIRTEADEVHYNLHILLRFDLEHALIAGDLSVIDLPDAWNERFHADFGVAVDCPSNGVLQDVHWSVGLFGYFPTYSIGNVYAGCLHRSLLNAVPDLDEQLARGEAGAATAWLRENLQRHGGIREPRETITHATGGEPTVEPLLDYLEQKFVELYQL